MDFTLRPFCMEDADSLAYYANNPNIAKNLRNVFPQPYTKEDAVAYLQSCIEKEGCGQITRAIVVGGQAVGSIGIFIQTDVACKTAELGYFLGEPFWGNGIASRAISSIIKEAFSRFVLQRIFATPFATNLASCRVLEKAGFTLEGILRRSVYKNGMVLDSCMYAITCEECFI